MKLLRSIIYGALIGVTFIIPGMSGSTIAVMLGIYDEIIDNISNLLRDWKRSLPYLIPLGIGALIGVYSFAGIVKWALADWVVPTNFLFVGLMMGSIPLIYAHATKGKDHLADNTVRGDIEPISFLVFLLTFVIMMALMFFAPAEAIQEAAEASPVVTVSATNSFLVMGSLIFACFVAAATMVVPGISGALMFVIFGVYGTLMTAVHNLDMAVLIPAVIGAFVGLLVGARIINMLLARWEKQTYWGILGLVCGSIVILASTHLLLMEPGSMTTLSGVLFVVGAAIGAGFGYYAQHKGVKDTGLDATKG